MLSKSHPSLAYFVRNYISNEMFTCACSIMFMIFHPQLKITQTWTVPQTVIWGGPKSWVCQRNTLPQIILQIESYFPPSINQSRRSQNGMINKTLTCSCLFDNYLHYLLCVLLSLYVPVENVDFHLLSSADILTAHIYRELHELNLQIFTCSVCLYAFTLKTQSSHLLIRKSIR